jgi:hypothetical protein
MIKSLALFLVLSSSVVGAFAPPRRPTFQTSRVVGMVVVRPSNKAPAAAWLLSSQQQQSAATSFALRVTTSEDSEDTTKTTADPLSMVNDSSNYQTALVVADDDDPTTTLLNEQREGGLLPEQEELSETKKLMKQVKDAGTAGVISYALWEFGFWALSVPVVFFGYREVTGHWPDISNQEDVGKLGAEAFAFVNFARFAVPLRIGLALSTTPWIQGNIVDRFLKKEVADVDSNSSMDTPSSNGEN